MTDYSEAGATPTEDAAVARPPTVDEVRQRQREQGDGRPADDELAPGRSLDQPGDDVEPNEPA